MKKALFIIIISLLCAKANAQGDKGFKLSNMEAEIFIGPTLPIEKIKQMNAAIGSSFGLEARYRLDDSPLDFGLQLDFTTARRSDLVYVNENLNKTEKWHSNYNTTKLMAVGDWNFDGDDQLKMFVGMGLGLGFQKGTYLNHISYGKNEVNPVFTPRAGITFMEHVRVTLSSNITNLRGFSNLQLNIGVVLPGRWLEGKK